MLELTYLPWRSATPPPILQDHDLHVWLIPCGTEGEDPESLWHTLSAAEQARASRFKPPGHREAYVRAHAGLRLILSGYLATPPKRIDFDQGRWGKPCVPGPLEFNLTTSGDLALVALRWDYPVGIDCERLTANRDMQAIARRLFAPAEVACLLAADEAERPSLFARFWTALEATVKMDGRGLFHPSEASGPVPDIIHFVPRPGYVAAIASQDAPPLASWTARRLDVPGPG
jgi:4'-phosphopantetheinyl transferase